MLSEPNGAARCPRGRTMREKKASLLSNYSCNNVLGINFSKTDKFRVGKLRKWIVDEAAPQLKSYIMSEEIKKKLGGRSLKAHVVVVVGSRQILVWDMDDDGELVHFFVFLSCHLVFPKAHVLAGSLLGGYLKF